MGHIFYLIKYYLIIKLISFTIPAIIIAIVFGDLAIEFIQAWLA